MTLAAALVTITALVGAAPAGASAASPLSYEGNSYGTYVAAAGRVVSGESAASALGCLTSPGYRDDNTLADVGSAPVIRTGAIDTSSRSLTASGGPQARTRARAAGVSLLGGLIRVRAVTAASATTLRSSRFTLSAAGSELAGLTVAGVALATQPAPNTTIALPGVGAVVLDQQQRHVDAGGATLTVDMIHVYVAANVLGLRRGTQIVVGHAASGLARAPAEAGLDGLAYGAYVRAGSTLTAGPAWPTGMCDGTGDRPLVNSLLGLRLPGLSTGAIVNTARGTVAAGAVRGETSSQVTGLNLLSGLVTASTITSVARLTAGGGRLVASEAGTSFVDLRVAGGPILDPAPDTKIQLPGLDIWVNRMIGTGNGLIVRGVEIVAGAGNQYGLAPGSDIQVAVAEIAV
jgi:hypothetical protein